MLLKHIALVSLSKKVSASQLSQTAAALQKQAARDLGPIWGISATVDSFPTMKSIPMGYWPIIVSEDIKDPDAAGFHTDKNHQPYSLVLMEDDWQLTCSHEMCEMLVDPYGNRMATAGSPKSSQGKVHFLVEVCDPCEDAAFAYSVNGILMSDFYTPNYFDPQPVPGVRYSFTGAIKKPVQILKNGYISWQDPVSRKWFQSTFFGTKPVVRELKEMQARGESLRAQMDRLTKNPNVKKAFKAKADKHKTLQGKIFHSAESQSDEWIEEVEAVMNKPKGK
jgi:hypothetical protein